MNVDETENTPHTPVTPSRSPAIKLSSAAEFVTPLRKPPKHNLETPFVIPPSPLLENLGYGTGVKVYRLERSPRADGAYRSPWAVKQLCKRTTNDEQLYKARLFDEATVLRKLDHPNIVGYRGYKKSDDGKDALVMEDCHISLGNILEMRDEELQAPLPAKNCKTFCRDIAKALEYLHTTALLLHGDMKSFNILVKGDFEICKLCDFGVSQPINDEGYLDLATKPNASYVGTDLWSAPEVLIPDNQMHISCKADIFAFGMIIYECIALMPPHMANLRRDSIISISDDDDDRGTPNKEETKSFRTGECITISSDDEDEYEGFDIETVIGTRPPLPQAVTLAEDYNTVIELFYMCTNTNPEDRPSAKCIKDLF